jgi:putative endopeptidase
MRPLLVFLLWALTLAACGAKAPPAAPAARAPAPESPVGPATEQVSLADVGLDGKKLDRAASPCEDFYQFACGGWIATTEIPEDHASYGTFNEIFDRNEAILHDILDKAAAPPGDDPVLGKIGRFYGACMDETAVEKSGIRALDPLFAVIRRVKDGKTLLAAVAELHAVGADVLFTLGPAQDKKDATQMIAQLHQGGLGLLDRDYYLENDERTRALRAGYLAYLQKLLVLAGRTKAAARQGAADTVAIETALARTQKTRIELRDEIGTYNRIDRAGLAKAAPGLPWDVYFQTAGIPDVQKINATSTHHVESLDDVAAAFKPARWRSYLDAHLLMSAAPVLPKKFVDANFELARMLTGQKQLPARWKRCVAMTDNNLGELLALPYIQVAFPGDSKAAAERMLGAIFQAFENNLGKIEWMDDATKDKARDKLKKIVSQIGYPERPRSYGFAIDSKNLAGTVFAATREEHARQLGKIGKPVDKTEWFYSAPTVNAGYDPSLNEMIFPAGILQTPFYDVKASAAVNFGAIGMIAGHELTHGFDDQGAQYDGDGNLSGWWPANVTQSFKQRTDCVANYYSEYEPLPGVKLKGAQTNGENIADMGGVKMAFSAYRAARRDAKKLQVAEGFTEDQQFFLAVGQAWCEKSPEEFLRLQLTLDVHSPARYRVLGSLSALPEFAEAFQCPVGAKMRPKDVCRVW